jgi:hypothetical protein
MNDVTTTNGTAVTAYDDLFEVGLKNDDMSAGVSAGFGFISFRGSKWRIKRGGEETPVLDPETKHPTATLPVVMLQVSPGLSRIYYEKAYTEGDDAAPDCSSLEGVVPDPDSPKKQSDTCASCPHQVWGSRVTDAGKKSKKCQDSRRVVVVPAEDIPNEKDGGPMLLRVPAASLKGMADYGKILDEGGFHYRAVKTRLGFDMDASYPLLTFSAIKPLTAAEKDQAKAHFISGAVANILGDIPVQSAPVEAPTPTVSFEEDVSAAEAELSPATPSNTQSNPDTIEDQSELDTALDGALGAIENILTDPV